MQTRMSKWLAIGMAGVLPLSLAACDNESESEGPDAGVDVGDLQEADEEVEVEEEEDEEEAEFEDEEEGDISALEGRTVTVSGEVGERITPPDSPVFGFILAGEDLEEGVLVLQRPGVQAVEEGELVQVTGTVVRFILAEVEAELGEDLDDELFNEFEGHVALIADAVDQNVPEEEDVEEDVLGDEAEQE
jgi:hypothetical protein